MPMAAAGEARVLTSLLDGVYISLHTASPGSTGANEVSGGAYSRVAATFTQSGSNPTVAANDALVQFPQAAANWGTITHFGIWSASSGGDYLGGDVVSVAKAVDNGDIARWDIGMLTVTAD